MMGIENLTSQSKLSEFMEDCFFKKKKKNLLPFGTDFPVRIEHVIKIPLGSLELLLILLCSYH